MPRKPWMDISVTIKPGMARWPGDPEVRIRLIKDMKKGDMGNLSLISMGSHTGTHMDAPFHFLPAGASIDEIPWDAVLGPARVLEIRDSECVRPGELRHYRLRRGERILFKTINSRRGRRTVFMKNFVYISSEAAQVLAAKGVRTVGVDYLSVGGYYRDGVRTHQDLLEAGIWIIEGLDLSRVRPGNYDLICLPLKILNADGAPARAIIRRRFQS